MKRIRVVIADDHSVARQGLRAFLKLQDDVQIVGEATDGEEAVAKVQNLLPDVVLMDLVMPRLDGTTSLGGYRGDDRSGPRRCDGWGKPV